MTEEEMQDLVTDIMDDHPEYEDDDTWIGNWEKGGNLGTKYGITPGALRRHKEVSSTRKAMRALTKEEARNIYLVEYVRPMDKELDLPEELRKPFVELAVTHGYQRMCWVVQMVVRAKEDRFPGLKTQEAIKNTDGLLNKFIDGVRFLYEMEVAVKPTMRQHLGESIKRVEKHRDPSGPQWNSGS